MALRSILFHDPAIRVNNTLHITQPLRSLTFPSDFHIFALKMPWLIWNQFAFPQCLDNMAPSEERADLLEIMTFQRATCPVERMKLKEWRSVFPMIALTGECVAIGHGLLCICSPLGPLVPRQGLRQAIKIHQPGPGK